MSFEIINEEKLETIIGGQYFDATLYIGMMTVIIMLVAAYKMYTSSKGKARFGNDYTFEWS